MTSPGSDADVKFNQLQDMPVASHALDASVDQKTPHSNNFNLLRFVFASLVIVAHAPELRDGNRSNEILTRIFGTISFGDLAVDSFFLLSGFLIVKSWRSNPAPLSFLANRVLRIYPGFIVAILICAFVVGPSFAAPGYFQNFHWKEFSFAMARLSLKGIPDVFPGTPQAELNSSVWTISYEFKCYLLVLACGMTRLLDRRWLWPSLFFVSAVVHIANIVGIVHVPFYFYIRFLMAFTAGGCFYLYRSHIPWRSSAAWICLAVAIGCLFSKALAEPALCVFWAYALFYYASAGKALLGFNRLPDVSYGVYLYAWPINKMVLWWAPAMNLVPLIATVFVLSVIAGTASWYLVEGPFMRLKKTLSRRRRQRAVMDAPPGPQVTTASER